MSTTVTIPALAEGERYAGICLDADGTPTHHLVLLPGDGKNLTWKKAKEFAAKAGGALPTRQEQALLYANCKDAFELDWYWSGEQHAEASDYAWFQTFYGGYQLSHGLSAQLRARAVRSVAI